MLLKKPTILIISPMLAKANNGNWQTARRWADILQPHYDVQCLLDWNVQTSPAPDMLIALHARRSAPTIAAFADAFGGMSPKRPLVLILTGTDLYRDIRTDALAQRSLELATHLVVLQPAGLEELTPSLRSKAHVIFQSAPRPAHPPATTNDRQYQVIMIGHLRAEKRPDTFMQAASLITNGKMKLLHIGGALDSALGDMAAHTDASVERYTWLGPLSHEQTLEQLYSSALMVISSEMEGGANVIIEAMVGGVAVLASDIPGNRGMLGEDYAGYFPVGDAPVLAHLIDRAASDIAFQDLLAMQCARRAELFAPAHEQAAVLKLADNYGLRV